MARDVPCATVMSGRIEGRAAMVLRAEEAEVALIQSVCDRLRDQIVPELVDQGEAFVRQFYHWVPREDLAERSVRNLCGAAIAVWDFARDRTPSSASVRAYNLGLGQDGWKSANTIVEVVTDDMPFLVSSVEMELSRRGYGIHLSLHPVIDVLRDADGRLAGVFPPGAGMTGALPESLMQFEVDREPEPERLEALVGGIRRVVGDVRAAVEDWRLMRQRLHEIVAGFESAAPARIEARSRRSTHSSSGSMAGISSSSGTASTTWSGRPARTPFALSTARVSASSEMGARSSPRASLGCPSKSGRWLGRLSRSS